MSTSLIGLPDACNLQPPLIGLSPELRLSIWCEYWQAM